MLDQEVTAELNRRGFLAASGAASDNPWVAIGTSLYIAALAGALWPVYLLIVVITGLANWLRRP